MIRLSLKNNDWIKVCDWETKQAEWTPTLDSLKYHKNELEKTLGSNVQLKFLCGGDLVETFKHPGVWRDDHIKEIVSDFGLTIISRIGTDPAKQIYESDILYEYKVKYF